MPARLAWIVGLGAAAWLFAAGVGALVQGVRRARPPAEEPVATELPSAQPAPSAQAILEGRLFGQPATPAAASCEGVALVSTVVAADPAWSFAAIRASDGARLYRVGDRVGGRSVAAIDWRSAVLMGPGSSCRIDLFDRADHAPAPVAEAAIDRELARLARDPSALGRLRPVPGGFEIRFGRQSPLSGLGLERGDILREIDGRPATDLTEALAAWRRLLAGERVAIGVERRGRRLTLGYRLR
jgi:hypothetical protein